MTHILNPEDLPKPFLEKTRKDFKDLTGKKFYRLKVLYRIKNDAHRNAVYVCKCDCGNLVRIAARGLGKTISCGCYQKEKAKVTQLKNNLLSDEEAYNSLYNRFHSRYKENKQTGCFDWVGWKDIDGYGIISYRHKNLRAHHVPFILDGILVPNECVVMHSCDNPSCVNPSHLSIAKSIDNLNDKMNKGRQAKGSRIGNSKLTEAEVYIIYERIKNKDVLSHIAKDYNVSNSLISDIKMGRSWNHITNLPNWRKINNA